MEKVSHMKILYIFFEDALNLDILKWLLPFNRDTLGRECKQREAVKVIIFTLSLCAQFPVFRKGEYLCLH